MITLPGMAADDNSTTLKQFTLEDLNFGGTNYRNMVPKNRYTAWWGDELVRIDADACYLVNKQTGKETELFNEQLFDKAGLKVHGFNYASFPEAKKPWVLLPIGRDWVLFDWKKQKTVWTLERFSGMQAEQLCYASKSLAYVDGWQLYVERAGSKPVKLTTDGSRQIVYGQSVHRDEFGITGGLFWSPDGQKLAFYRMDQSMVTDYPQVDIPEPKAGDPTDRYFTNISWSPDAKTIYMFELNRDQNDCRLVSYDATTGDRKAELYRETDDKYVEPLHPIVFLPWDANKFVMQSRKDGYNHFYLFDKDGKQLSQLTKGPWEVEDMVGFDAKRHSIIYLSNAIMPLQCNIFSVNVDNGRSQRVDEGGKGWHNASLSASGNYVVDNYSEPTTPRNIAIVNTATAQAKRWFTAPDPWKGYNVPEYRMGTIKAADGTTDLYYRMVMPVGFDPNKKYPTIIYVYGGPHAHNVDARWHYCSRSWETYMAQKGYLLFILDNRGSENRGKAFEQVTFRHLGDHEVEDQMEGVKYLKSLAYVDSTRLGVHGWSFGGFMTINMMTTHPGVFKVGVAGGPVIDWKWYEVMYGERYMDTPQTNPDGYAKSSLIPKAKNLKDRLEIIIGYNDVTCVPQHSLSFLKACIEAGTQPDFFVYPGEPHNMRGHQSVHLHERISRYFDDYLK